MNKSTKIVLAVVLVLLLVFVIIGVVLAARSSTSGGTLRQGETSEVEDCDAEDFRNKEADCGFRQTKKPTPKASLRSSSPAPAVRVSKPAKVSKPVTRTKTCTGTGSKRRCS